MKVITTAIFSVTMLSRKLSVAQWLSVLALTIGIGIVQVSIYILYKYYYMISYWYYI